MASFLQPTLDLWQFYVGTGANSRGNDIINVPLGGAQTPSTWNVVPAGKLWYVTNLAAFFPTQPAVPYANPYISILDASSYPRWVEQKIYTAAAGAAGVGIQINKGFWMDSGWAVAAGHAQPGGTAISVTLQMARWEIQK